MSYTVSCNSILKISGKLGITTFRKSPAMQLQHRLRCVRVAQCIMLLKNKCLYLVMPLVRNRAVGFATLPVWLRPASRSALQTCLCVRWPLLFQNSEAFGSWGQIQSKHQICSFMCFLKLQSISVALISLSRSKANEKWWGVCVETIAKLCYWSQWEFHYCLQWNLMSHI